MTSNAPVQSTALASDAEANARSHVAECVERYPGMLDRLRNRAPGLSRKRLKKAVHRHLSDPCCRIAGLTAALKKRRIKPGQHPNWPFSRVISEASKLHVEQPHVGKVRVQRQKADIKVRWVFNFADPRDLARQIIAHDALNAVIRLPKWAFIYNGGDRAVQPWLSEKLPKAAIVLTSDFPKCFQLLPWRLVEAGLPFSRQVTRSLIFDPWKVAKLVGSGPVKPTSIGAAFYGDTSNMDGVETCAHEIGAGRGIPQGSVLSALVAQIVLQGILTEELSGFAGIEVGLFADDLIILLSDESLEGPVRARLVEMMEKHFDSKVAHLFRERTLSVPANRSFDFLGRRVRAGPKGVTFDALPSHCERLQEKVASDLAKAKSVECFARPVRRTEGFVGRHIGSPRATRAAMRVAMLLREEANRYEFGDHRLNDLLDR